MKHLVQRCLLDRSAGVALTFAVSAIAIVGTVGIAVDFGFASQAKTQLNAASDAAALAAAKGAADAFSAGDGSEKAKATGEKTGREWFKSQASATLGAAVQDPNVTVTQSGAVFSSTVTYQGSIKPYFASVLGMSTVALAGLSSATITTTAYVSVTFLLDNSSSMLVAATQEGVNKLALLTPSYYLTHRIEPPGLAGLTCAFACHWDANNNDYYGLARKNNIQLRFDVLQIAAASAINQMINQRKIDNQFGVTVYTFDSALKQIYPADKNQPISTNLADGVTAVQNFQTPVVIDDANTNFPAVMKDLAKKSTASGDGSSMANRKKALIIVTDGLADYGSRVIPSTEGPINPADCAAMKNLGYNVYVLYTTFVTAPLNAVLLNNTGLLPYLTGTGSTGMVPSLQACASAPTNFAQASDPVAINAAMSQMLQSALGNAGRYTQ